MTLRNSSNPAHILAHAVLDDVRAGIYHNPSAVRLALRALGEPVDYDMPDLRPLVASSESRHGKARLCTLRPAQTVDDVPTAAHMQQAQARNPGCPGCPRGVAHQIIEQSRQCWQIGLEA